MFTYLHLAPEPELTKALIEKKVVSIAYETVQLENRSLPICAAIRPATSLIGASNGN
ncbi:alanine dehydrogenase, partial [Bacillus sp. HC-Mk]